MIEMEEQFRRGRLLLDKLELFDAENLFREILQRVTPADSVEKRKYVIEAMAGIAECESKRCQLRRTRKELDWFCGMLFAQCLYQEAGELCAQVLRAMEEAGIPLKSTRESLFDRRCFQDIQSKLASQLRVVEEQFVSSMKDRVLENCVEVGAGKSNHFKDDWLQNLLQTCQTKDYDRLDFDEGGSDRIDHSHDDDVFLDIEGLNTSTEALYDAEWERRFLQTPDIDLRSLLGKKKVNFDRFQEAIQQLVSEVSKEIRSKYQHMSGDIPQGLIDRRLSSELAMRLSPGSKDAIDLINVFEESMTEEDGELPESEPEEEIEIKQEDYDSGAESSEEDEDSFETIQLDIAPSALHEYTWRPEQSQLPVALTNGTLTPEAAQQKFNCLANRIDAMVVSYGNTKSSDNSKAVSCGNTKASDNNSKVVSYGNTKASDNNSKVVSYGNKNNFNNLKGTDSNPWEDRIETKYNHSKKPIQRIQSRHHLEGEIVKHYPKPILVLPVFRKFRRSITSVGEKRLLPSTGVAIHQPLLEYIHVMASRLATRYRKAMKSRLVSSTRMFQGRNSAKVWGSRPCEQRNRSGTIPGTGNRWNCTSLRSEYSSTIRWRGGMRN